MWYVFIIFTYFFFFFMCSYGLVLKRQMSYKMLGFFVFHILCFSSDPSTRYFSLFFLDIFCCTSFDFMTTYGKRLFAFVLLLNSEYLLYFTVKKKNPSENLFFVILFYLKIFVWKAEN